ncbi:MAG: hypothetical protein Devi2KO_40040 [Devosia indica]|jgi:hypothetical protein
MYALDRSRDAIFIERLHAKTLARGLKWNLTEHEGRYQVQIGEFVVEIGEGVGSGDSADIEVLICSPAGKALEILTPEILQESTSETAVPRRRAFAETYEAARRMALGVDQVIENLIEHLL